MPSNLPTATRRANTLWFSFRVNTAVSVDMLAARLLFGCCGYGIIYGGNRGIDGAYVMHDVMNDCSHALKCVRGNESRATRSERWKRYRVASQNATQIADYVIVLGILAILHHCLNSRAKQHWLLVNFAKR